MLIYHRKKKSNAALIATIIGRMRLRSTMLVMCLVIFAGTSTAQQDHYDQLPDLGSGAQKFLTDYEAEQLGKSFIRQSRFRLPYVSDPELVSYINDVGNRLLKVSEDYDKEYSFYLINNHLINAFAVPGGHIAMHTAILTKSESESELASVMAHEIAHVTQNHISRRLENSQYDSWIALGALLAAAATGSADAAQAAFGVSQASIIDKQLRYSRSFETEADSLGIRLLSRAGYDPSHMPVFFKRLLDENRINESNAPEFFRSHPLTINRITESAERVRAYPEAPRQDNSRFELMRAKATAAYTRDKELTRDFYADKLKNGITSLPIRYGYGLVLSRNGEFSKAREVLNALDRDYPDNVSIKLVQADNELEAGEISTGLSMLGDLYKQEISKGNHIVDVYYANALVLTKQHETAIPMIRKAISDNPDEPYLHILLSRAYGESGDNLGAFTERGEYHYLQGNYSFAIQQYKRAFRLTKTEYQRARLAARIEDVEREIEAIKRL